MEAVASGRPKEASRADGNVFFLILFNYKILLCFVALIYFAMNEKILSAF